jgi:hypothetical protein
MEILTLLTTVSWFSLSMLLGIIGVNSPQVYRPFILFFLVCFASLAFRNVSDEKLGFEGTESLAMFCVIYISHITCVLCVEKYTVPSKTGYINWKGGYNMLFNARWLGTDRLAPDVHKNPKAEINFESGSSDREEYLTDSSKKFRALLRSPRGIFLRNRVISFCAIIATLQIYNYTFFKVLPQLGFELEMLDFLPSKESYFRRLTTVTLRETLIRTWIVLYWTFYSVGLYTGIHDVLAFIFVGTGFDKPEDWPPLFGSIRDATSVRYFWGKYWHRLVYRSYTSYGKWVSQNILRLPRNSLIGKMFINFYVFAMSGAAHAIAVRQLGFTCGFWEEIAFYCNGFLAILLEGLVVKAFSKLTRGYKVNKTLSNTLGYVWVFTYLFATIPKTQYPKLWCAPA